MGENMKAKSCEDMAVSLMTDVRCLSKMQDLGLRETYFEDLNNKKAYEFTMQYWNQSMLNKVPSKELLEKEIPELEVKETDEDPVYVVNELKKKLITSRTNRAVLEYADIQKDDPVKALSYLSDRLWTISKQSKERANKSEYFDSITKRRERYKLRSDSAKYGLIGMSIGFPEIDEVTMGLAKGELCTIAAPTKTGKTWIGLKIAAETIKSQKRCVFFTLELSVSDIEDRLDAIVSGVSYSKLSAGQLNSFELKTLHRKQDELEKMGHILITKPKIGERNVQNMLRIARDFEADVIVIDQLSFMEASNSGFSKSDNAAKIIDELKTSISEDEDNMIPAYLLSQMNRAASFTDNGRGKITNIALTSNIENASDLIIGLGATKEQKMNNSLVLEILGSRRTGMKSWLIKRELVDCTDMHVIKEMTDEDVDDKDSED
jgi:replicative DNA helicase